MHRCFQILEIYLKILYTLRDGLHLNALASLAATCKTLHEPALDVLWEQQDSLVPLLKCFPPDLWHWQIPTTEWFHTLVFTRPISISPGDWERFDYYARRVKKLQNGKHITRNHIQVPSLDALKVLSVHSRRLLLPNLHSIGWLAAMPNDEMHIHPFLGPKIKVIDIKTCTFAPPSVALKSIIASLPNKTPFLEELRLDDRPDKETSVTLSQAIFELPHLRSLFCGPYILTPEAIRHISRSDLRKWWPCDKSKSILASIGDPSTSSEPLFRRLQSLTVTESNFSDISALIKQVSLKRLTDITIHCRHPLPDDLRMLCEALADGCNHDILGSVCLDARKPHDYSSSIAEYSGEYSGKYKTYDLEPLLSFPNLTHLEIALHGVVECDNTDLRRMSLAWPRLQVLTLYHIMAHDFRQHALECTRKGYNVTLDGLIPLVTNCPDLQEISIVMNAVTSAPLSSAETETWCTNENVDRLNLGYSTLDDPWEVASFLLKLDWSDRWNEVGLIMYILRDACTGVEEG